MGDCKAGMIQQVDENVFGFLLLIYIDFLAALFLSRLGELKQCRSCFEASTELFEKNTILLTIKTTKFEMLLHAISFSTNFRLNLFLLSYP